MNIKEEIEQKENDRRKSIKIIINKRGIGDRVGEEEKKKEE
jgi:hypothetical protein